MSSIRVSIIIPCYNVEDWVDRALASAVGQTHPDKEIICVDNASTDGTLAILQKWATEYPELISVVEERKRGAPAARNAGLAAARGEWIQFLDADDELKTEKIAHQLQLHPLRTEPAAILAAYRYHEADQSIDLRIPSDLPPALAIFLSQAGITSANLWHRERLLEVGGWNESYPSSQEYELLFRLWQADCTFIRDDGAMTDVYYRPASISTRFETAIRGKYQLRAAMYPIVRELEAYASHREEVDYFFFKTIRDYGFLEYREAIRTYRTYFPGGYQLPDRQIGRFYSVLHHWCGFAVSLFLFRLYFRWRASS